VRLPAAGGGLWRAGTTPSRRRHAQAALDDAGRAVRGGGGVLCLAGRVCDGQQDGAAVLLPVPRVHDLRHDTTGKAKLDISIKSISVKNDWWYMLHHRSVCSLPHMTVNSAYRLFVTAVLTQPVTCGKC
jgi:hypothetical protein